jgi:diguanylate cyclase (GGDEF)-like protein
VKRILGRIRLTSPLARRGTSRSTLVLRLVIVVLLVAGLAGSVAAGSLRHRSVMAENREEFEKSATDLSAAMATTLLRNADAVASAQAFIAVSPDLHNPDFQSWYDRLGSERYPGLLTFGFIERVPAEGLDAFAAAQPSDLAHVTAGEFAVVPEGERPEYCLPRLVAEGTGDLPFEIPRGLDLCQSPGISALLERTRNSGRADLLILPTMEPEEPADGVVLSDEATKIFGSAFFALAPVYSGADQHRGWVLAAFDSATIVRSVLRDQHGLALRLSRDDGATPVVVAETADPLQGDLLTHEEHFEADGAWTMTLSRSASSALSAAHAEKRAVTGAGMAFSLLVAALLWVLIGSRNRAVRMVDTKTDELRHQALHDALTGLPNRALALDRADQMLARSRREQVASAALFVDIDNFKAINDTLGHGAGDDLLCAVAKRIRSAVREVDTVARLGGDEFVVLADGGGIPGGPDLCAQRLLDVMAEPFHLDQMGDVPFSVQVSIGIASGYRACAGELLRDADVALYQAKSLGKGRYVVFEPEMQAQVQDRLQMEMDLFGALGTDQMNLVYQPTFSLADDTVLGVEALLRWNHPRRGPISPTEFIPLAEDNGMIIPLGEWVLIEACRQAAEWHAADHRIAIHVNVSPKQLETEALVETVRRALASSGLPAEYLVVEITESGLMTDPKATAERLARLKESGVRIAIDDFGTGYSSLAYLQQFPVDTLKIDRSFVMRMSESSESHALVHMLVQLGKTLGIETFAEGIELGSQLQQLRAEQCDSGQGFLFAHPLEADAVITFLEEHEVRTPSPVVSGPRARALLAGQPQDS